MICISCNSTHLTFTEINIEVEGGLTEFILSADKFQKLDKFTCRNCGFVMFFDPKITRV